jgi:hypothetical protein
LSTSAETPPVKAQTLSTRIEEENDVLTVIVRDAHWTHGFLSLLFLPPWALFCVFVLLIAIEEPKIIFVSLAIIVWCVWIAIACRVLSVYCGRRRLVLAPDGLYYQRHIVIAMTPRVTPLSEIRRFSVQELYVDSDDGVKTVGIELTTLGRSINFGINLTQSERAWLASRLNEHLARLRRHTGASDPGDGDLADCRNCNNPSDSSWTVAEQLPELTFEQRGQFNSGGFLTRIVSTVFFIAAIGLFVPFILTGGLNCALLFGLPAAAFVAWMFIADALALFEPCRCTQWQVMPNAIQMTTRRFGLPLGWRWRYRLDSIVAATIRDGFGQQQWQCTLNGRPVGPIGPLGKKYGLMLIGAKHRRICAIKGLTLGEARWIKGRLQEHGCLPRVAT